MASATAARFGPPEAAAAGALSGAARATGAARVRAPRAHLARAAPRPALASLAHVSRRPRRCRMSESTYNLFQRGRRHLRAGMAAQATVALEKAKRREPDKASIREALGIAYFRIRRWSEAEAEFRAVLELSPVNDYAHYALGRSPREAGTGPRGERALQAGELAPAGVAAVPGAHPRARLGCARLDEGGRATRLARPGLAGRRDRPWPVRAPRASPAATGRRRRRASRARSRRLRIFPDGEGRLRLLGRGRRAVLCSSSRSSP